MTIRLLDRAWEREFIEGLREDSSAFRIICSFIKTTVIENLLSSNPKNIRVITRFNLADFASGVSDVAALRKLIDIGAGVRGVRNLHAKLYIMGASRAIVASANLTEASFSRDYEIGVVADDEGFVNGCLTYFNELWHQAGPDLCRSRVDQWHDTVECYLLSGGRLNQTDELKDFGKCVGIDDPSTAWPPMAISVDKRGFVKLLGNSRSRASLSTPVIKLLEESGCHWSVGYKKRPRNIEDGDAVFIGWFTRNPNDIRIFGRAIGKEHQEGRDDASDDDKRKMEWKHEWSRYVRVHHAEFVEGTLENGVSLYEMMDKLEANSFETTKRNACNHKGNTNPRRAYGQRPDVRLSGEGSAWLNQRLQQAFETHGRISQGKLDQLDWPDGAQILN